jgi:60 kDa SS-A/Ro ribonucleoprotein
MLALDVSGSMDWPTIAGLPITPRVAAGALSLVTAATEPSHVITAFSTGIAPIPLSPRQRLEDAQRVIDQMPAGGTDCSLPMLWASQNKKAVDLFVVYTDSETWAGDIHPMQALQRYRQRMGIPAKLVVVGMASSGFSIADPNDSGTLDVVGFDVAVPQVLSDFIRT